LCPASEKILPKDIELHQQVRQSDNARLRLPMVGQVASLNAATADSVALYLAFLARQGGG
jgi:tRNA G18 (ribose-2'-O)-methylase SpoU